MLPRSNRLTRRADFQRVYRQGRRVSRSPLRLHLLTRRSTDPPRLAFVVPNRVAKRATDRNRWKRVLREASRPFVPALPVGTDGVLILNDATALTAPRLRDCVRSIFTDLARPRPR